MRIGQNGIAVRLRIKPPLGLGCVRGGHIQACPTRLLPFSAVDRALVDDNRTATFALVRAIAPERIFLKHPFLPAFAEVGRALSRHVGMIARGLCLPTPPHLPSCVAASHHQAGSFREG